MFYKHTNNRMKSLKNLIGCLALLSFMFASCSDDKAEISTLVYPSVVSTSITNGATGVSVNKDTIQITFDRKVFVVYKDSFKLNGVSAVSATADGKVISVVLPALAKGTTYSFRVGKYAVKTDSATVGAVFTTPYIMSFTTEVPTISDSVETSLVTTNPTTQVVKLYNYLKECYGSKMLSATMANVNWNTTEADWVYTNTGKYPAINCFDFIHIPYSPANWINYNNTQVVEDWWNNGGIVACMWHWLMLANDDTSYSYEPGTGSTQTSFDVSKISDTSSDEYKKVMQNIDTIANQLLVLQNKGIPVIWRPLHEAAGNTNTYTNGTAWFWWGAKGPTAFKALWKLMFNEFNAKGVRNLIWVWTSECNDSDWYPGDNYVDIIGCDDYSTGDQLHGSRLSSFNKLKTIVNGNKIITMSECSGIPNPTTTFSDGATWSWFMPWYGDYTESSSYNGASYWKTAMSSSNVITRGDLPSFK